MEERHLSLLTTSIKEFNEWREINVSVQPDLSRADLSGLDLRGANLQRANLRGANLSRANLSGCDLTGADLSEATVSEADLSRARLMSAVLDRADLSSADLSRADLTSASFMRASFAGANLEHANLYGVAASHADLSSVNLGSAKIQSAQLDHVRFTGASVEKANFFGSDVEGADFTGVDLEAAKQKPTPKVAEGPRRESRYQRIEIQVEEKADDKEAEAEFLAAKIRLPTAEERKKGVSPIKLLLMGALGVVVLVGPLAYDYFGPRTMPLWNLVEIRQTLADGVTQLELALKGLDDRPHLSFNEAGEQAIEAERDLEILRRPDLIAQAEAKFGPMTTDQRRLRIEKLEELQQYAEQDEDHEVRKALMTASEKFERVLELDEKHRDATFHLARCLHARGQFAAAGKLMRKYLELKPKTIVRGEVVKVGAMAKPVDKERIRVLLRNYPKEGTTTD